MPDLLTDEAYSGAIQLQDKETLAFFWQRREAQNPLYRAYYFLLQGQTKALLAQIKLTPQVLGQSVYPNKICWRRCLVMRMARRCVRW